MIELDNIGCAEIISDILAEADKINFSETAKAALCKARYETQCKHSPIGEYKCYVKLYFSPQSGRKPICVDTCLQAEINDLIRKHKINTVGCCCGHGIKQAYIQVSDESVNKMIALGYKLIPLEPNGDGPNCFVPKSVLPVLTKRTKGANE